MDKLIDVINYFKTIDLKQIIPKTTISVKYIKYNSFYKL